MLYQYCIMLINIKKSLSEMIGTFLLQKNSPAIKITDEKSIIWFLGEQIIYLISNLLVPFVSIAFLGRSRIRMPFLYSAPIRSALMPLISKLLL